MARYSIDRRGKMLRNSILSHAILALIAALATEQAAAFDNGRNVLLKNMTACLLHASRCKEVHLLEPAQCIQSNGPASCNVPYVISLPENDAGAENRGKTLLIPVDIISDSKPTATLMSKRKSTSGCPTIFLRRRICPQALSRSVKPELGDGGYELSQCPLSRPASHPNLQSWVRSTDRLL